MGSHLRTGTGEGGVNSTEALAEAWASMDGKLDEFRAGKKAPNTHTEPGGHYSVYMADATELMKRLESRGFVIVTGTT